jgi:hypothetical protein
LKVLIGKDFFDESSPNLRILVCVDDPVVSVLYPIYLENVLIDEWTFALLAYYSYSRHESSGYKQDKALAAVKTPSCTLSASSALG